MMQSRSAASLHVLEGELIDLIYASLVDEGAWALFLDKIRTCLSNGQSTLFHHDEKIVSGAMALTSGVDPEFKRLYEAHYSSSNLWMKNLHKRPVGLGVRAEYMCPFAEIEKTEYYHDLLRPHGIKGGVGITLLKDRSRNFMLSVVGEEPDEAVEQRAADMLTRLAPHLARVFVLHRRGQVRASSTRNLADTLSAINIGVVVVGAGRQVQWANQTGSSLLESGDGIGRSLTGRLTLGNEDALRALDDMVALYAPAETQKRTLTVHVGRKAASPLKITVAHAGRSAAETFFAGATAILLIEGGSSGSALSPDYIKARYGLTRREADVAMDLVKGLTLNEIADRHGIARETVRLHLKNVFAKTETNRQAALIAKLLSA